MFLLRSNFKLRFVPLLFLGWCPIPVPTVYWTFMHNGMCTLAILPNLRSVINHAKEWLHITQYIFKDVMLPVSRVTQPTLPYQLSVCLFVRHTVTLFIITWELQLIDCWNFTCAYRFDSNRWCFLLIFYNFGRNFSCHVSRLKKIKFGQTQLLLLCFVCMFP